MAEYKIIILDDDDDVRLNLQIYFEDEGYECKSFEDAKSALEFIEENKYDAGIIDLRLPLMTGEEFIYQAQKINPNMKFIIYTGSTDYQISDELIEKGITQSEVFHKPVKSMDIFVKKIRDMLENR